MDVDRVLALADTLHDLGYVSSLERREAAAALRALVAERQAVLDLHYRTAPNSLGYTFCAECTDDWPDDWPCDTVRALGVTEEES